MCNQMLSGWRQAIGRDTAKAHGRLGLEITYIYGHWSFFFTEYSKKHIFVKPYPIRDLAMTDKTRVLFVCVANAARSQLAEALLRHTDSEQFDAFSAGTAPSEIDPRTLGSLQHLGVSTHGLYSKSVDEFAGERFDYVITLCDKSSLECHALPGAGEVLAWNFEDPVTSTKHDAFRHTLHEIHERIKMFVLVKNKR
ncbi:hypothetical protein PMm318_A58400 [Pseudomonas moorei]